MQEFVGALVVDATRGHYNKFVVNERQVVFADELFVIQPLTNMRFIDRSAPQAVGRRLNEQGKKLYDKLEALGGKGVKITGEAFTRQVNYTHEFARQQECVMIMDVEECPAANPELDPFLADLLRKKEADDARKAKEEEDKKMKAEEDAIRMELLRDEMRERIAAERKKEKKKDTAGV